MNTQDLIARLARLAEEVSAIEQIVAAANTEDRCPHCQRVTYGSFSLKQARDHLGGVATNLRKAAGRLKDAANRNDSPA